MHDAVEKALGLCFVLVGLSHLLHGQCWAAFFEPLFKNRGGPFAIAMYTLPFGLLIVLTHNVWEWRPAVLATLYGWASIFKGGLYFLCPQVVQRLVTENVRSPRHFALGGAILTVLGALLTYEGFAVG